MDDQDDIGGKYGGISGKYGGISGKYGGISGIEGKYGGISGGPNERIERALLDGQLIDEIGCLKIRLRRIEQDLIGIAGALSDRISELEQKQSNVKVTVKTPTPTPVAPKPQD
jgi:hypothetical protein